MKFWCQAAAILHTNKENGRKHSEEVGDWGVVYHALLQCVSFIALLRHHHHPHHQGQQFVFALTLIF